MRAYDNSVILSFKSADLVELKRMQCPNIVSEKYDYQDMKKHLFCHKEKVGTLTWFARARTLEGFLTTMAI